MAIELFFPADRGTMDSSSYQDGTYLYDNDGNPVAIIVGKDANTPWTIYGEQMWIAVAVASKRFQNKTWDNYGTVVPGLDLSDANATLSTSNTSGDEGTGWYISPNTSEANMDRFPNESTNKQNSKAKTDAILALNANSAAAAAARSVTWAGGAFDLPRIEVLMRIYQARNRIDALDPTLSSAPSYSLGSAWGFGSSYARVWSSSVHSAHSAYHAWYVDSSGNVNYHNGRTSQFGVLPALEILV